MNTTPDLVTMLSVIDSGARTRDDILTGPPMPTPHGRAFGGQVLGQALAAAATTLPEEREIHSMHAYFLRPGDSTERMTFEVSRLHDGRSFSTRRTQAFQEGQALMAMIASYQDPQAGFEHEETRDLEDVPAPDELQSVWEKYGHLAGQGRASWVLNRPFDFRYVESDVILSVAERSNRQLVWMRARDTMPDEHSLHAAALAFGSDYLLTEPILRRHGIPWATPGLRAMSLDHAIWFHRPFRVDEWLLYDLVSPTAQAGRGLTEGRFYDREGHLIATVAQEVAVRLPEFD